MKFLLVAIVVIGLSSVIGSIIIGSITFDGTVNKKPYETGLVWDQLQREKDASGLNIVIKNDGFTEGTNVLALEVLDKAGKPLKEAAISVTVSRPSTAAYDKTYNCARLDDGSCLVGVAFPLYGYWDLKIRVLRPQSDIVYTRQVFVNRLPG